MYKKKKRVALQLSLNILLLEGEEGEDISFDSPLSYSSFTKASNFQGCGRRSSTVKVSLRTQLTHSTRQVSVFIFNI